jgi:TrwC relaxase
MSYYTASGEPPGQWAGKGAATLGLTGQVDPAVIARLYQHNIGPGGELLVTRRQSRAAEEREEAAVAAYRAVRPYANATELAKVRVAERGTDTHQVPYFDLTVDVVKSVSVLHASYRVAARQSRERGDQGQAAALDARGGDRGCAAGLGAGGCRVAGTACHLHPDRAPFGPDGGVAGRGRPGRQRVPAPHQP